MRAAGLLWLLLLSPLGAAGAEVVIEAGALTPQVLTIPSDEVVVFVNNSGRMVHIDFLGRADEHHVFQVAGRIRATFHRLGRHPYVVHFATGGARAELRGVVEVQASRTPRREPPVCTGVSVQEICIEP